MIHALASRLRNLRQTNRITQEQLCRDISVDTRLYYHYEKSNGNIMPPYIVVIRLSRRFNVSIAYLLGLTDNATSSMNAVPPPDDAALKVIFSSRITNLRKSKGFAQSAAAQSIGVSLRQYQTYESESNPGMPSYETLVEICRQFDCSVDYLLGNSD